MTHQRSAGRQHRQGTLQLVLLGSLAMATACAPRPDDVQENMKRPLYLSQDDCRKDWSGDDCERTATRGGSHAWWGPYYSSAGRVYHYDGRVTPLSAAPAHKAYEHASRLSPNEVFSTPGRYVTAAPHASATSAKAVSRGGFGGRSGVFSGGG